LLQDVAVIPAIAIVNLLAAGSSEAADPLRPGLIIAVIVGAVAARFLLRPLLRFVAASGIHELFTAAALALVAGAALAMGEAGLSMGLGAFVAGMMVADSEFRHQLEADVTPFKGLLLGLFFIAVGMSVDVGLLAAQPVLVVGLTVALMAAKALVMMPLARWHGLDWPESLRSGLMLSQGGEFAFVLLTAGVGAGLVDDRLADLAVLVVTLSMAVTPAVVLAGDRWLARGAAIEPHYDDIDDQDTPVVVTGFGRVGQIVARVLAMRHIPFTALEINPLQVDFVRQYGNKVYYGDATRVEVLRAAGLDRARAIVIAVGSEESSMKIVERVRANFPRVAILARATTRHHELLLRQAGVRFVLRDTLYSSLRLASTLLEQLGLSEQEANAAIERFREHDAETLDRQSAVFGDEDAFRKATVDAAEELKRLFAEDAAIEAHERRDAERDWDDRSG
jgi:voltage-gated potassium channel Kch